MTRDIASGRGIVSYKGQTFNVSIDFLDNRMRYINDFKNKERFFTGFYHGTNEGIRAIEEQYKINFENAIMSHYTYAPQSQQLYAIGLWQKMTPQQRDRFSWLEREKIGQVFNYDSDYKVDRERLWNDDPTVISKEDEVNLQELVDAMEEFVARNEVATLRKQYGI